MKNATLMFLISTTSTSYIRTTDSVNESLTGGDTWFERVSMSVILLNCLTLGLYKPCSDEVCATVRCRVLQVFDHLIFDARVPPSSSRSDDPGSSSPRSRILLLLPLDHLIFVFFAVEMLVKMTAMGVVGKKAYLSRRLVLV